MITLGDPAQMPPVRGSPLHTRPKASQTRAVQGYNAYHGTLDAIVYLATNFRAGASPEYQQLLARLRLASCPDSGHFTASDLRDINATVLGRRAPVPDDGLGTPEALVFRNSDRVAIARAAFTALADRLCGPLCRSPAPPPTAVTDFPTLCIAGDFTPRARSVLRGFSQATTESLRACLASQDKSTGNMSPTLCCAVGVPLVGTWNVLPSHGAANGSVSEYVTAWLQPHAVATWGWCSQHSRFTYTVPASAVVAIVVRSRLPQFRERQLVHGLGPGEFLLEPQTVPVTLDAASLPQDAALGVAGHTLRARFTQIPAVLGWATTLWRLQGRELDRLVVLDFATSRLGTSLRTGVYVALSRVRRLDAVTLLADLPEKLATVPGGVDALGAFDERCRAASDAELRRLGMHVHA